MLGLFGGIGATAETATTALAYDFDLDEELTVADLMLLLRHIDGWDDGIIAELEGDVSGDGKVSIYDVVCFLKLLLNDTFEMEKALAVVTYNIKAGYYSAGQTLSTIAEMLREVDADIVGLQEVDYLTGRSGSSVDQLAYLAEAVGYTYYKYAPVLSLSDKTVAAPANVTSNLYGHGILSKYPINKSEIIWTEAQTIVEGNELRNVERHEIQVGDKVLAFYNSHMDLDQGRYQYKEIQDNYMVNDQYAVFVGDMNETIAELNSVNAINYDKFELLTNKSRIDHIIVSKDTIGWFMDAEGVSGWMVASTTLETPVVRDDKTYTKASDHDLWYSYIWLK